MITHAVFLTTAWLMISLLVAITGSQSRKRSHPLLSLIWLSIVILLGDLWAVFTFGRLYEVLILSLVAGVLGVAFILFRRDWNARGLVASIMATTATIAFLVYAFSLAAFTPLSRPAFLLAIALFFLEALAMAVALVGLYRLLAVISKITLTKPPAVPTSSAPLPHVFLVVPVLDHTNDEVCSTLSTLERLKYPAVNILVVDASVSNDNRSLLPEFIDGLGPAFIYLRLEKWPAGKTGVLNFAISQAPTHAELIAIVEPGWRIDSDALNRIAPVFHDPQVAFAQTRATYRVQPHNAFSRGISVLRRYDYDLLQPFRARYNAVLLESGLALIRLSALRAIGGWDEWNVRPELDAGLRMLQRGGRGLYDEHAALSLPITAEFDRLKQEQFTQSFGSVQLWKKHRKALMPWSRWIDPSNRLTPQQRNFYLVESMHTLIPLLNLAFISLLITTALLSFLPEPSGVHSLIGPLLVPPLALLVLNGLCYLWMPWRILRLPWKEALQGWFASFATGWVSALGSVQGLVQPGLVYLRLKPSTLKTRWIRALSSAPWETAIAAVGLTAVGALLAMGLTRGSLLPVALLAVLSLGYLTAAAFAYLDRQQGIAPEPQAAGGPLIPEARAANWAIGLVGMTLLIGAGVSLLPQPVELPPYSMYLPAKVEPVRQFSDTARPLMQPSPTPPPATPVSNYAISTQEPTAVPTTAPTLAPTNPPPTNPPPPTVIPAEDDPSGPLPPGSDPISPSDFRNPLNPPSGPVDPPEPPPSEPPPEPPPSEPPPEEPPEPPPTEPPPDEPPEPPPPPPDPVEPPPEPVEPPPPEPTDPPEESPLPDLGFLDIRPLDLLR